MHPLRSLRWGVLFACLSIAFGFVLGGLFGLAEEDLKGKLKADGEAALAEKYGGDAAKLKPVLDKAWIYFQRAHLHGGGIGAVALALCLLLAALPGRVGGVRALAGGLLGAGALGYAVYWLLAGLRAPGLGGTGPAKDSLEWLAVPTSGMALVGLALAILVTLVALFGRAEPGAAPAR